MDIPSVLSMRRIWAMLLKLFMYGIIGPVVPLGGSSSIVDDLHADYEIIFDSA